MMPETDKLTFRHAAISYLLKGYSVIPLIGKKCPMGWAIYQQQRATGGEIQWWESQGWLQNLGVVCGTISGNLVVIDLDGAHAVNHFQQRFPDYLQKTYVIRTGSGGLHVYLKCDHLPKNRKVRIGDGHSGVEMRGEGQYVVAPPSIHPITNAPYQIAVRKPVLRVYDLSDITDWLETLETPKKAVSAPMHHKASERPNIVVGGDKPKLRGRDGELHDIRFPRAYAAQALADEAHRVGSLPHGTRNDGLHQAAVRMGQLVNYGWLSEGDIESALMNAARRWSGSQQTETEIIKTIRSGIEDGKTPPRGDFRK